MTTPRFAICQELFEGWTWERQCRFVAETGYQGLEVAPFTLGPQPASLSATERADLKRVASESGLEILGLHWLLARTEGFHLTTADAAVRRRTADYLIQLTDLCADLGGSIMVFGSPHQRSLQPGVSAEQAFANAVEVFRAITPRLASRGVTLAFEPLSRKETDFMVTCDDSAKLIAAVDHANFRLHQDVKAMADEGTPYAEIIRKHKSITRHFHANDVNLRGPGMGDVDFHPIFAALHETGYDGWISVEVFDYTPGAETITRESMSYMRRVWQECAQGAS